VVVGHRPEFFSARLRAHAFGNDAWLGIIVRVRGSHDERARPFRNIASDHGNLGGPKIPTTFASEAQDHLSERGCRFLEMLAP
jgi:hypothetical protein